MSAVCRQCEKGGSFVTLLGEAWAAFSCSSKGLYWLSPFCYIASMRYGWVAVYLGVDVALIVSPAGSAGRFGLLLLAAAALAHPLFGFAIGSYWALLLPFVPALMALPAGTPAGSEWSVSASLAFLAVFQSVLLVSGVVARQVRDTTLYDERSLSEGP